MEAFLLIARLILAIVFGLAGVAKLSDRDGSENAIAGFGIARNLAKPLAVLLPLAEIMTAILLLPTATAWFGAIAAAVLLTGFIGLIVYHLVLGKTPDCHCFGRLHSEPIGQPVLARNLVLALIAVFVVWAGWEKPGASAFAWFEELSTGERMQFVFNVIFVGLGSVILFCGRKMLKNQETLHRRLEVLALMANENGAEYQTKRDDIRQPSSGLPIGARAPDFIAPDLNGKQISLERLVTLGQPVLLLFVSPTCHPCTAMLPAIESRQTKFGAALAMIFVSSGNAEENKQKFRPVADGAIILLQQEREICELFLAKWTPSGVLINPDRTIGSDVATGENGILALMDKIKGEADQTNSDSAEGEENVFAFVGDDRPEQIFFNE